MEYEGWHPPGFHADYPKGTLSWRNRNPGNLRPSSPGHAPNQHDRHGYRVFPSLLNGYFALINDLTTKFAGFSKTGITPESTLLEFFEKYAPAADHNEPTKYARTVANSLAIALGRPITIETRLWEIKDLREQKSEVRSQESE